MRFQNHASKYIILSILLLSGIACSQKKAANPTNPPLRSDSVAFKNIQAYQGSGSITQGLAQTTISDLFKCKQKRGRPTDVGEIQDQNGKTWTVPAENNFSSGSKAFDLYNECVGVTPSSLDEVDLTTVPVTEIDPDGEVITGYLFGDNYFECYINGELIAVDPVPFTPFNSNVVKFKAKKPYTIAVKLIDWEENLGLGSESNRGKAFHPGDGGFIASFSDGTITNAQWKAQTFYTAPVQDLSCLNEEGTLRSSGNCNSESMADGSSFYGVHWEIPEDSFSAGFDDEEWPNATTYTDEVIGVDNKMAYMNFIEKFSGSGAEFIWSSNVVLDNEVIIRYTVK